MRLHSSGKRAERLTNNRLFLQFQNLDRIQVPTDDLTANGRMVTNGKERSSNQAERAPNWAVLCGRTFACVCSYSTFSCWSVAQRHEDVGCAALAAADADS